MDDARRNLRLLRAMYGPRSAPYRRLLDAYREVADALNCRRELERVVRTPTVRPKRRGRRPRPVASARPVSCLATGSPIPGRAMSTTRLMVRHVSIIA